MVAKIETDIKMDLFKNFQKLSANFYNENKIGQLISVIINDSYNLSVLIKESLEIIIDFIIKFFGSLIVLLFINKIFTFISFGLFLSLFVFIFFFFPKLQKKTLESHELTSKATDFLEESLHGIREAQSFTNEELEFNKFFNIHVNSYLKNKQQFFSIFSVFQSTFLLFTVGLVPLTTLISIFFIFDNYFSMSDLAIFIIYLEILTGPVFSILWLMDQFHEGFAGFKRIVKFLSIEPEIKDSNDSINLKCFKENIKFKNVSFCYPNSKKYILDNVSFEIKKGQYVALVGYSGSGKTTIASLIPRFYDVSKGEILIDNVNVKDIKLKSLRQNITFINQNPFLFSGSIMDNIRYGKPNAQDSEVFESAKKAHAHDFIIKFPEGYNTQVGPNGLKLSGGQKQRISLARAFIKASPILIFDEITSNLDDKSEKYIQESFKKLSSNCTLIVITHKLSTIKNAEKILVISDGRVVENGNHEDLLKTGGVYSKLYKFKLK